jgi:hypothetical protein
MATTHNVQNTSDYLKFEYHDDSQRLRVRVYEDQNVPFLHACYETNTFIIDPSQLSDNELFDLRNDLIGIDGMPVPFGQFSFWMYDSDGQFFAWSTSDQINTGLVCIAFQSFGYTPSITNPVCVDVSKKDQFKLNLKFGYAS